MLGTESYSLHEAAGEMLPRGRFIHTPHTHMTLKPAATGSLTATTMRGGGA